jgi:hypothetical protein
MNKDKTDYNGTESNIGDTSSWFPFHKALSLEHLRKDDQESNSNDIASKIEELEGLVEQIVKSNKS